jgi:hypothetical protein
MNELLIHKKKTSSLYTTLYYSNLESFRFQVYGAIIIRIHVSEVFKRGNHIAVAYIQQ